MCAIVMILKVEMNLTYQFQITNCFLKTNQIQAAAYKTRIKRVQDIKLVRKVQLCHKQKYFTNINNADLCDIYGVNAKYHFVVKLAKISIEIH